MNALGNLHLDAAIPVTVAAMSLKVIRVSQNRPFLLRRGYEDLSSALRCSSVCSPARSPALFCLLSCALMCALLRSCALACVFSCAPVRSCVLSCASVRSPVCSPAVLCALLCALRYSCIYRTVHMAMPYVCAYARVPGRRSEPRQ